jgi:hypothetical protein
MKACLFLVLNLVLIFVMCSLAVNLKIKLHIVDCSFDIIFCDRLFSLPGGRKRIHWHHSPSRSSGNRIYL